MERAAIYLPSALKRRACQCARQQKISFSEFARQAIEDALVRRSLAKKRGKDPFWSNVAVYKGPVPADLSANHDKYLYDDDQV